MIAVSSDSAPTSASRESLAQARPAHPMFPRGEHEVGPERRRIDLIQIERLGDDGTWETCPRVFKASDLRSWNEVVNLFGGGVYRARAQCARTYQWQGTTERKQFCAAARPFVDETKPRVCAPVAPPSVQAQPHAAPHGWAPRPAQDAANGPPNPYGYPPAWMSPLPTNIDDPPVWLPLLLKVIERRQQQQQAAPVAATAPDPALFGTIFQAMADRDALLFRLLLERPGAPPPPTPAAAPAVSTLELLRELKPLLERRTSTGQFMEGVEIAKSLAPRSALAPAAPEDFAATLGAVLRKVGGPDMPGLPGSSPPPAPPAPAAAPPPAPVIQIDDVLHMAARDPRLVQCFMDELSRNAIAPTNSTPPVTSPAVSATAPAGRMPSAAAVCAALSRTAVSPASPVTASPPHVVTPEAVSTARPRPASAGPEGSNSGTAVASPASTRTAQTVSLRQHHPPSAAVAQHSRPAPLTAHEGLPPRRHPGSHRPESDSLLFALTGRTVGYA